MQHRFCVKCLLILFTITSYEAATCPTRWRQLTSKFEIFSGLDCRLSFAVQRRTQVCSSDNRVFRTERFLVEPQTVSCNNSPEFDSCEADCDSKTMQVELNCTRQDNQHNCTFEYVIKNCNRVSWGAWEASSSCTGSNYTTLFSRTCFDCDGMEVDDEYCEGNSTDEVECEVFWSQWAPWSSCEFANTATTGTRTRTRSCFYESAEEVPENVPLCQDNAKSQTETCDIPTTVDFADDITSAATSASYATSKAITEEMIAITTNSVRTGATETYSDISVTGKPFDTTITTTTNNTSTSAYNDVRDSGMPVVPSVIATAKNTLNAGTLKDKDLRLSNPFLGLFLWVTIPIAVLFLIAFTVLLALLSRKCKPTDPEKASQFRKDIIGPLNGDLYASIVRK